MNITISYTANDSLINVDVVPEMTLLDLRAYIEAESEVKPENQKLTLDGKTFAKEDDNKSLESLGIKNNDLLVLSNHSLASIAPAFSTTGINPTIEFLRNQILNNPQLRAQLPIPPAQQDALLNDSQRFAAFVGSSFERGGAEPEVQISGDPDDPENQKRILEQIRQKQIEENIQAAYEFSPEIFADIHMLYIEVELNDYKVKAFVDSGAQRTILSTEMAEKCDIARLIDKRFSGVARGFTGDGKIEGRIHSVPIKIGKTFYPWSFTIVDSKTDLLVGLDFLKRYQGIINLKTNKLEIGSEIVNFLPENQIPQKEDAPNVVGGEIPGFAVNKKQKTEQPVKRTGLAAAHRFTGTKPKYPEATINQLMSLGFTRDQVTGALDATGGNSEFAASYLFQ